MELKKSSVNTGGAEVQSDLPTPPQGRATKPGCTLGIAQGLLRAQSLWESQATFI